MPTDLEASNHDGSSLTSTIYKSVVTTHYAGVTSF